MAETGRMRIYCKLDGYANERRKCWPPEGAVCKEQRGGKELGMVMRGCSKARGVG